MVFSFEVQNLQNAVGIGPGTKEITDIERLQILISIELVVLGIGDRFEPGLILGGQNGFGVAPKIGPRHRDQMHLVAGNERPQMRAELVVGIGRDVVEFIQGNHPIVEGFYPELVHGNAEGRVGADQRLIIAFQKTPNCANLAVIPPGSVAQVPLRRDVPICPKAKLTQWLIVKLDPMDFSGTTTMACLRP